MDKKRWIIVGSVILSMSFVLFVLDVTTNRDTIEEGVVSNKTVRKRSLIKDVFEIHDEPKTYTAKVKHYGQISYPEPPKHVFDIENETLRQKGQDEMKIKGKIIK